MREKTLLIGLIVILAAPIIFAEWTPYTQLNSPLETNYISSINVSPDGRVLIGSNGRGLYTIDSTGWDAFNEDSTSVYINYANSAEFCGDSLFIGSASGNLDTQPIGEGLSYMTLSDSLWAEANDGLQINQIITGIAGTPEGRIVSTYGGGISLFTDDGWIRYQKDFRTEFTYADSQQQVFKVDPGTYIPSDYIKSIDYDANYNILWIGTLNGGAVSYDGNDWVTFNIENSGLPSNRIQTIETDPVSGTVYFGTFGFGLAAKSDDKWHVYNTSNSSLLSDYIYSLATRPDSNHLWIGTNYAINVLQADSNWQAYLPPDSGLVWGDYYSDIAFDSSGNVWVSTFGGGIASRQVAIEQEPEPEYDSLFVDVQKLKIFLREPRRNNVVWLRSNLEPEVDLVNSDTVSAILTSDNGEVYSWMTHFEDFICIWDWGNRSIYATYVDGSTMVLTYQHNRDRIKLYLLDWQPSVAEDNITNILELRVQLGDYVGYSDIYMGQADPSQDPDADSLDYDPEDVLLSSDYYPFSVDVDDNPETPSMISLPVNYPNPFNPYTTISFGIDRPANVNLTVYDVLGRAVTEKQAYLDAGNHSIQWNGSDKASGVYYYVIRFEDEILKGNMTLLK